MASTQFKDDGRLISDALAKMLRGVGMKPEDKNWYYTILSQGDSFSFRRHYISGGYNDAATMEAQEIMGLWYELL